MEQRYHGVMEVLSTGVSVVGVARVSRTTVLCLGWLAFRAASVASAHTADYLAAQ